MDFANIMQRVQHLRIKTRRLLAGKKLGDHSVRHAGGGFEFDQLRDYQVGDDFRSIDWNSSVRSNKLIIRSYREDRNRTIVLLVDTSCSNTFGSRTSFKKSVIQDIAVMLSCAAEFGKDSIGAIFFDKKVRETVPARTGRKHIAMLSNKFFETSFSGKGTSLAQACSVCLERFGRNALIVILSDCIDLGYEKELSLLAHRHEVVVLRINDTVEKEFPAKALIRCEDPETGILVDCTTPHQVHALNKFLVHWRTEQDALFKRVGVDCLDIPAHGSYDEALAQFFEQRA